MAKKAQLDAVEELVGGAWREHGVTMQALALSFTEVCRDLVTVVIALGPEKGFNAEIKSLFLGTALMCITVAYHTGTSAQEWFHLIRLLGVRPDNLRNVLNGSVAAGVAPAGMDVEWVVRKYEEVLAKPDAK